MTTPSISLGTWSAGAPSGRVRLTNRGRAVLVGLTAALAAFLVVGLLVVPGVRAVPAEPSTSAVAPAADAWGAELAARGLAQTYTVVAGDTLWELALAIEPGSDPRPLVDRIQRMNGLADARLAVGDRLWLPIAQG